MNNSLAVRQFMAVVKGEKRPAAVARVGVSNEMRVETVKAEFGLCQRCLSEDEMDVIDFSNRIRWVVCRKCRQVHENGEMTDYVLLDEGDLLNKNDFARKDGEG